MVSRVSPSSPGRVQMAAREGEDCAVRRPGGRYKTGDAEEPWTAFG